MKICKNCGNELLEGVTACPFCGCIVENDTESQKVESQQTKKKGKLKGVLITVAVLVVARLVGGLVGEFTAENIIESSQENDIEVFINHMDKYVPGYYSGNEYVSENFGFRFAIDENWEFYSEEDLKTSSEAVRDSVTSSSLAALEKEDVSENLKGKFVESIYAETEMGAMYIADGKYVGEVTVGVMSVYGIEGVSADDYISQIKNSLKETAQVTDEDIAGSTYKVLSAELTDVNGIDTKVKMYVKIQDNMVCMITCRAMVDYGEQLFKAFEDRISAYK